MTTLAMETKSEACGACGEMFATLDEVFSHDCPEIERQRTYRRVVGHVPTEPHAQPTPAQASARTPGTVEPATEKQVAYLRSLLAEREGVAEAEVIRASLNADREAGTLGKRQVSKAIDSLLKIEKAPKAAPGTRVPAPGNLDPEVLADLQAGRYFVQETFVRVDRPERGTYAGFIFVKRQPYGPDSDGVRFALLNAIAGTAKVDEGYRGLLDALLADPLAAAVEYGHHTGSCCVCGRTLTDPKSIEAGIGPICGAKFRGWGG